MVIKWYIDRTHSDLTIYQRTIKQKEAEEIVIAATRRNLIPQLEKKKLRERTDYNLYLVDGTQRGKFNMMKIKADILRDCTQPKRLLLLKHARENSEFVAKYEALESRIPEIAAACTKRDMIPLSSV